MTLFYPDIASGQAGMSPKGSPILVCKSTQGTGYLNPDYLSAKERAARDGVFFVAYHFLESSSRSNIAAQAAWCYKNTGKTPLMIDDEPWPAGNSYPSLNDAMMFLMHYRALGGICFLNYFPHWYWVDLGRPNLGQMSAAGLHIVSSDYTSYTDSGPGWAPYGGITPSVWQYTSSASFNGYNPVDFNAYKGTLDDFKKMVTGGLKPPPPAPSDPDPTVRLGDINSDVSELQRLLNDWGIRVAVDGNFGPSTEKAVVDFQRAHRLKDDGVVGPVTWGVLERRENPPPPPRPLPEPTLPPSYPSPGVVVVPPGPELPGGWAGGPGPHKTSLLHRLIHRPRPVEPVHELHHDPGRVVADGSVSLDRWLAREHKSLVQTVEASADRLEEAELREFTRYLAKGTAAGMPEGLVFCILL